MHTEDREAFLDAMETLYRLSTKEGVHQYGHEYKVGKQRNQVAESGRAGGGVHVYVFMRQTRACVHLR